jgi:hypothetical protein
MEWEILYISEDLQRTIMGFPAGIQARFIHLKEVRAHADAETNGQEDAE